ncbi:energy-coupling factor transporter transmembrane protein EcfT [Clostridium sp. NSJ-49]|uniref:Cobalt ABC transporter permease n=1 Tax=Clostridium disporicum TaxID=84024 RepID=A0A173ZSF6_9CLOT|nr:MULTISPECIES: energy-coupling factor transporter transmembrane component T [Clostridium]MBC5624666.1 energy-coupling factor transporter transmembrane protein EcfT [Clostridium sp. NSJ-49]MCD2501286.1 energy-coupling factor transporter transmembrane protein EcfT [Clostridium sp. NSJ-145]MDU6341447.1 energy-coupling factor transporter transmembrane component T [Clostridium sp.]CUN78753.1 cobalt ABC transporter permease [Clostridium disporicum]
MSAMLEYQDLKSPIHKLTGATKLIALVFWALASMVTYDTRILGAMFIFSIIMFKVSKVKFKDISFVLYFILVFLLINNIAIFFFSPYEGVEIYKTRTDLFHLFGPYTVTTQQLFYQFNVTLKYFSIIPMALLFMVTTNPSEFAASLNRIGVSYKISYSVAIALRYIPDIQRDYHDISFAQQARGIDMSKKAGLTSRVKNSAAIIMPLIFSSLERIESISSAMELRAFGNNKKRTWYSGRPFEKRDYIAIAIVVCVFIAALVATKLNGGRFFNPF